MSTLNLSMHEPMRVYIDKQATRDNFSASEYVRQIIREDQKRRAAKDRALLWDYLAISARQLDEGDFADVTVGSLLEQGRARRATERKV